MLGLLSLSQVRHCKPEERAHKEVQDIMLALEPGLEIGPQASAIDAIHKMNEANSGRLVVVDAGKLVGLITRTGVARIVPNEGATWDPSARRLMLTARSRAPGPSRPCGRCRRPGSDRARRQGSSPGKGATHRDLATRKRRNGGTRASSL